ncbi:OLC1v1009160C1 [Oldenlandia corymbosa var. corymbosa]|uniref:OLC1v1009160C1 n=1 Tax=Oldenlandia corymbosa var. corymbosa TaxID=529605 RepID=A0AAV1DRH0_OLDCO|nr:OLC1v1009160C1 [Oldenlandia corymbosa var. corymbosa]
MLRRSILQLSSCRSNGRIPIQITTQMPSYLASRRAISATPQSNEPKGPSTDEAAKSGISFPVILGGVAAGAASVVAYRTGYLDKYFGEKPHSTPVEAKVPVQDQHGLNSDKDSQEDLPSVGYSTDQGNSVLTSDVKPSEKDFVVDSGSSQDSSSKQVESQNQVNDTSEVEVPEHIIHTPEDQLPSSFVSTNESDDRTEDVPKQSEENVGLKKPEVIDHDQRKAVEITPSLQEETTASQDSGKNSMPVPQPSISDSPKDDLDDASKQPASLLGEYYLKNDSEEATLDSSKSEVRSAAALKALEEEMEEKLKAELENKANEAELELKKVQELAKAELAAAVAREKASQIEKMAEANLHINALCMAFYARSEEARQSHSVHKLALGALALEDALSKGLPIQQEIEALSTYLEGIDKDSLLDLVLLSLPEETRRNGTDTLLQLNQKFNALKGTIRHFSYIPPGGGGILSHSLANVASTLKVSEADQSGDGIESLMNKVANFLAQGKLSEAADALENGVKGTQAAEVVGDWVTRARNRAITEQALTLLQSYATSISLT